MKTRYRKLMSVLLIICMVLSMLPVSASAAETTSVSGSIVWVNREQQDSNARPTSVTLTLYANGAATDHVLTVTGSTSGDGTWPFTFSNLPALDENGQAIEYTVVESAISGYEITYSADTLTITNSYTAGVPANHTFKHIDVRINGAQLEVQFIVKDTNGTILEKRSETITAYVTKVESVTINGTTYSSGFESDRDYEFRKMEGVSISGSSLTSSSTAVLVVDLKDDEGNTYDNVSITYGLGGIMDAAYECDGYGNGGGGGRPGQGGSSGFDGLDFVVGAAQNYTIQIVSYGVEIDVQKYVKLGDETSAFSGEGGEFSFLLTEYENGTATGRTWTISNNAAGQAAALIQYPYDSLEGLQSYHGKTYTYTLTEVAGSDPQYTYDKTEYTFTVSLTVSERETDAGYEETLVPTVTGVSGPFVFTNTAATTDISGSKTWDDADNQDGKRPGSITINLLADGEKVASKTVTEADGWTWSFTDLPKYENGREIVYTITEDAVNGYTAAIDGYNVTNTHVPETIRISGAKTWEDNDNQDGKRPGSITIRVWANGTEVASKTVTEADNWTWSFVDLPRYANGEEITYTITEDAVDGYTSVVDGYHVTNIHEIEKISVSGSKTWDDADNQDGIRPGSITVRLLANGVEVASKTVTEADGWAWSFTNLDKYADGKEITYTITEDAVDGYASQVDGWNVTNSHEVDKTFVPVAKVWNDAENQDGIRPNDITVKLLANGADTGRTLVLNAGNGWAGSFTDLDQNMDGKPISYTVEEVSVTGYTSAVTGDQESGYTITNVHTPEVTEISGSKTWNDNDDQDGKRPESITINLLADGAVIETVTVTAADGWAWSFDDLPVYKNEGTEIIYSVTEDAVEGYSTEYNGFHVVNTHTPEKISITVTKAWDDADNQDGYRANDITVVLLANGADTGKTLVLNSGNSWTGSFTELDKYADGEEVVYTIDEVAVDHYTTTIAGDVTIGFTITNVHTPETVDISGSKTWDDGDNQDGARPESITIRLLANGVEVSSKTVTEADGWAWSFTDLPKYEKGEEIGYTIVEDAVKDYSTIYNGYNITNTHTPAQTSITVTKAWADSNNQDGIRPNEITVRLLANGADTGRTLVLSSGNNWTGSFTQLDVYEAGEVIEYTVEEVSVPGYASVITGDMATGYTITNSHTPETIDINGTKIWNDGDNQDGKRPASITVNLIRDGRIVATTVATAESGWAWSFENLPRYENGGQQIVYSVTEVAVDGYTTVINGYEIINTYAPEKTSVTVTKAWADNNNQDGIRPADITVVLLADGQETGKTLLLSSGNNWTGSFTDLDKYADGTEIVYTVAEVAVEGYSSVITGTQTGGYVITNSHTPETIDIGGSKTWVDNDNQDGKRPEAITIHLMKNGQILETRTVTEADGWAWSFTGLAKYENEGTEIVYSITEEVVEDYSTEYDGYDVINTHAPEKTSVTVTKAWADNNDQDGIRPEAVEVVLLADGEKTDKTLKLDAQNHWTGSFADLDRYADGVEIVYTVEEVAVEGYSTVVTGTPAEGYVITNSHIPETVEISGSKTWDDADNQDGKRPESITIHLVSNGTVVKSLEVTAESGWTWTFTDLPKYENGGAEIVYAITENAVEGYSTTYSGYDVTNTYTPQEISITVTKAWADSNDAEGIRPDSVTVKLYADGVDTGKTLTLTGEGKWTGSFTGLAKYADGREIVYTIDEVSVKGYNTVIRGSAANGFVVTNSHTYIPNTGDERTPMLWIMLMFLSAAAIVGTGVSSRKRNGAAN